MRRSSLVRTLTLLTLALAAASCASVSLEDYAEKKPGFVLEDFFSGKLVAKGALYQGDTVTRRFTADIVGTWDGDRGRLEEVFWWDDGEKQLRTWQLEKVGPNSFVGTAGDIVGAASGEGAGNAFNWHYYLRIPMGEDSTVDVYMDDWIHMIDRSTVLNRTAMSFYGLQVGEVVLMIQKVDDGALSSGPY